MPGLGATPTYGKNWHGMVWDDAAGGYVAPTAPGATSATNATNAATTAAANAAANVAQPMSMAQLQVLQNQAATSAPGYIKPMSAADAAAAALGTSSLSEKEREAQAAEKLASDKFAATKAMRDQLMGSLDGIFGGTGGIKPAPGMPTGTGDGPAMITNGDPLNPNAAVDAAEAAALTSAKERGGERLASSLKGLHELMAERGINGSGIEAKDTRDLFGDYLHDQNDTERGLIQQRSVRAQNSANAQWQRQNEIDDRNYAAQQQAIHDKINALLQTFGMSY